MTFCEMLWIAAPTIALGLIALFTAPRDSISRGPRSYGLPSHRYKPDPPPAPPRRRPEFAPPGQAPPAPPAWRDPGARVGGVWSRTPGEIVHLDPGERVEAIDALAYRIDARSLRCSHCGRPGERARDGSCKGCGSWAVSTDIVRRRSEPLPPANGVLRK